MRGVGASVTYSIFQNSQKSTSFRKNVDNMCINTIYCIICRSDVCRAKAVFLFDRFLYIAYNILNKTAGR